MELRTVCPTCCAPVERRPDGASRCDECQPRRRELGTATTRHDGPGDRATTAGRGYDNRWRRLSERARALQPFCSDCGTTDDLTADHSPAAWQRRELGQVVRLRDIDVVCRRCNTDRGAARGARPTAHHLHGALEPTPCPVCGRECEPNRSRCVARHRDTLGRICSMSGQPWLGVIGHARGRE